MSYLSKNLSVLAYANGFTLWHYATHDDAATVESANYFDEAADLLRVSDMVMLNVDTDGTPETRVTGVAGIANGIVTLGMEPNKAECVFKPTGGEVVDAECREQLASVIEALVASGQMSAS